MELNLMKKNVVFFVIISFAFSLAPTSSQPSLGTWSFDFEEDNDYVYLIPASNNGEFEVEFFVSNSYLFEIEVEITFDTPFGGEIIGDDPMIVSVASGSNKSDSFKIGNINLFQSDSPGGKQESFQANAKLIKIGEVDVSATNDEKGDSVNAKMPRIYNLKIGEPTQTLEFNPDIVTAFSVDVTNHGNLDDTIGQTEVSDNCPLMTVEIADNSEVSKILKPQITSSVDSAMIQINVEISSTHPTRNCDVELRISSGGSGEGEGIVWTEASFRIQVKEGESPPPDDSEESGPINEPIVTEQNLPAPSFQIIIASLLLAFFASRRE
jgi:hypothetical protein